MLRYFLENNNIKQIKLICGNLNNTKEKIIRKDFSNSQEFFNKILFEEIKKIAIDNNDEKLANSQYVFMRYFLLFCNLIQYFNLLQNRNYKMSWDKLQDCFDEIRDIGHFTEKSNRLEIEEIYELLIQYEALYPYKIFNSSEYVISKSHCSICGKSMQSLECTHIKGELYWGEPAIEHIDEIVEFQASCLVSHPEDKRCIIELLDDERTEDEKFYKLKEYLDLNQPFLQKFSINEFTEIRIKEDIKNIGRKNPCPCGSGKKFKHCCGKDMYYKHMHYIVVPEGDVKLMKFDV